MSHVAKATVIAVIATDCSLPRRIWWSFVPVDGRPDGLEDKILGKLQESVVVYQRGLIREHNLVQAVLVLVSRDLGTSTELSGIPEIFGRRFEERLVVRENLGDHLLGALCL